MYYWTPKRLKELKERGYKLHAAPEAKLQASSGKHQADLSKDKPLKVHPIYQEQATEDTSNKPQAPSDKRQASSRKQQAPR